MNVHPVGHSRGTGPLAKPGRAERSEETGPPEVTREKPGKPERQAPPASPQEGETGSPEEGEGQKAAGVLRLLEAGHFKGVADVRLRINFFDQLSEKADAQAAGTVRAQAGEFVEDMRGQVEELIGPLSEEASAGAGIDELVGAFDAAVRAGVEAFVTDEGVDIESLSGALQAGFDTLVEELRRLLAAPGEGTVVDEGAQSGQDVSGTAQEEVGVVSRVPSAESPAPVWLDGEEDVPGPATGGVAEEANAALEAALELLTGTFEDWLSRLQESVNNLTGLADPSPPSGRGAAYDKFLAMYNQLRGVAPEVDELG